MAVPERLVVPTCLGCGAMAILGTCETGCREERADLVRAAANDELIAFAAAAHARADAFAAVAGGLAAETEPVDDAWQATYEAFQRDARDALRRHPRSDAAERAIESPTEPATTWWCPRCGGLDAPQPCLGICVWRPVEWVAQAIYDRARHRLLAELEREHRLRALMRRLAFVAPHPDQWERNVRALQSEARRVVAGERTTAG